MRGLGEIRGPLPLLRPDADKWALILDGAWRNLEYHAG